MIKKEEFIYLKNKINDFQYTSMNYLNYEEVLDYQIISENSSLLLIYGYKSESRSFEYHWACSDPNKLIEEIRDNKEEILLHFIPNIWVHNFEQAGFSVYAVWNDYFMYNLENIETYAEPEFLLESECLAASQVTNSCCGQSRGFTGQTSKWFKQWISGEAPAVDDNIKNSAVLIERAAGELIGIVCTGTYKNRDEDSIIVWIREVAVRPDYQRRGIARKLISQALSYGKKHGASLAFLAADECNTMAIYLYERIGFKANKEDSEIVMIRTKQS